MKLPIFGILFLYTFSALAQQPSYSMVVAGCESLINEKKWKDFRIGFGASDCIAEEFYKSGLFRLVEEKDDVKNKLAAVRQKLWSGAYKDAVADIDSIRTDSRAVAYGRLVYFGTPRSSVSMGPFGGNENAVVIKTEVIVMLAGGTKITGKGEGRSTRMAMTTLFKFSDEGVFFQQTEIGKALQTAIAGAV
ncbi:MAG TPA: hypothetical protein VF335_01510, partial [Chitinivibrionales bacterium]